MKLLLAALAVSLLEVPAFAKAPQPVRPVALSMYSGRWYQIAQIAKANHHPCPAATDDFTAGRDGAFAVVVSCRVGPPPGTARQIRAKVTIVPGSGAAKFRMSFFGGLIRQEYWVLDHADDQSWALMATTGGNYLWLLARRPIMDPRAHAAALARIAAMGYDVNRLTPSR